MPIENEIVSGAKSVGNTLPDETSRPPAVGRADGETLQLQGSGCWNRSRPPSEITISTHIEETGMLMKKAAHFLPDHVSKVNEHIGSSHEPFVEIFEFRIHGMKMRIRNHCQLHIPAFFTASCVLSTAHSFLLIWW
jgi:hypothetical protein